MRLKRILFALYLIALAKSVYGQNIRYWQIYQGDRNSSTGVRFQMTTSAGPHSGCVQYDGDGNIVGTGVACGSGSGSVTNVATSSPISGGPITTTGTISCPTCVTGSSLTSGELLFGASGQAVAVGNLSGDATTSGSGAVTVVKIDGTSVPVNTLADQLLSTTAAATGQWTSLTNCLDTSGNHLNYNTSTHAFSCGTSSSSSGTVTSIATTSPITGGTITTTGTIACATCVTSAASLTANLPVFGSGSQATAVGTRSGNTTEVMSATGSFTSGNCLKSDANGNSVDSGLVCAATVGGAGMVLLEEHTASSSAELDFTTCITSSYDMYYITAINIVTSANTLLGWQMSTDGGATYDTTSNYIWAFGYAFVGGAGAVGSTGATRMQWRDANTTLAANSSYNGTFELFNPLGSLKKAMIGKIMSDSSISLLYEGWTGEYLSTTAVNAFRLLPDSGNLTSGVVRCYGMSK